MSINSDEVRNEMGDVIIQQKIMSILQFQMLTRGCLSTDPSTSSFSSGWSQPRYSSTRISGASWASTRTRSSLGISYNRSRWEKVKLGLNSFGSDHTHQLSFSSEKPHILHPLWPFRGWAPPRHHRRHEKGAVFKSTWSSLFYHEKSIVHEFDQNG